MAYKHDYDRILTRLTVILSKLNDGEALFVQELMQVTELYRVDQNEK